MVVAHFVGLNMTHQKILRAKTVMEITGYSRIQLWRKSRDADDDFPAPVRLSSSTSKGAIGWHEHEILDWCASRPRVAYAPEAEAV